MNIVRNIPNTVTSMNLVCGIIGVVFAFKGRIDIAFPLMLGAAFFDFCDGLCARMLNAYSDMGKELDSLCDLVSFGVLPSVMLYNLMKACRFSESVICWIPLLIVVFCALRLAKFNVDERQHMSFIGLPAPACAILCGSICYLAAKEPFSVLAQMCGGDFFIPLLSVLLCFLLVCELPMFSLKISRGDSREVVSKRLTFALAALLCAAYVVASGSNWSLLAVLVIVVYIVLNLCFFIISR